MDNATKILRFLWWNLQDFAHFEAAHAGANRWPDGADAYLSKLQRVERALARLSRESAPQLLAFAEITKRAASDLRDRLFPGYRVHHLENPLSGKPDLHLAILYDPSAGLGCEDFLVVSNLPDTARPMLTVDYSSAGECIRFYACHWTARFKDKSEKWRSLAAHGLETDAYNFLHPNGAVHDKRHVVILGDLNEEPFGIPEQWLDASRDRKRAKGPEHYTDKPIHRVRLYNCSWRLLGEQFPHPYPSAGREAAGSYYWRENKTWHTFDQVIVSGSLLGSAPPFLDERMLRVACGREELPDELLGADGLPLKFTWNDGAPSGLSDHFPICGGIILP